MFLESAVTTTTHIICFLEKQNNKQQTNKQTIKQETNTSTTQNNKQPSMLQNQTGPFGHAKINKSKHYYKSKHFKNK